MSKTPKIDNDGEMLAWLVRFMLSKKASISIYDKIRVANHLLDSAAESPTAGDPKAKFLTGLANAAGRVLNARWFSKDYREKRFGLNAELYALTVALETIASNLDEFNRPSDAELARQAQRVLTQTIPSMRKKEKS